MLPNIDLNLLPALDALLRERNVTRAAQSLMVTQPAMSSSLARLRKHFDDPLLNRVGQRYEITPLGRILQERVTSAMSELEKTLSSTSEFDPATASRTFRIATSDYAMALFGSALARMLREEAPGCRLVVEKASACIVEDPQTSLLTHDVIVVPRGHLNELPHECLFEDSWVVVADPGTDLPPRPDVGDLQGRSWVQVFVGTAGFTLADRHLGLLGIDLHVPSVVESFGLIPTMVQGTELLGIVQRRYAEFMAQSHDIAIFEPAFELPRIHESVWWHPFRSYDPAHAWLLNRIRAAAGELPDAGEPASPTHQPTATESLS